MYVSVFFFESGKTLKIFDCLFVGGQMKISLVAVCALGLCHWLQYVRLDYVSLVAVCAPEL